MFEFVGTWLIKLGLGALVGAGRVAGTSAARHGKQLLAERAAGLNPEGVVRIEHRAFEGALARLRPPDAADSLLKQQLARVGGAIASPDYLRRPHVQDWLSNEDVKTWLFVAAAANAVSGPAPVEEVEKLIRSYMQVAGEDRLHGESIVSAVISILSQATVGSVSDPSAVALFLLAKKDLASGMSQGFSKLQSGIEPLPAAVTALEAEARLALAEIGNTIDGCAIPRERIVLSARKALAECRFVQIGGLPGTGKSAVLRTMVQEALEKGAALFLKSDRLTGATWAEYATSTGMGGVGLEDLLIKVTTAGSSTVFIDGLDRVEMVNRGVVNDVVNTMLDSAQLSGLRILVTVRDTGMEHVRTWLPARLFTAGAKTVEVMEFDDQEANALATERPALRDLLFGSSQVKAIVRRPFFASVLAKQYANETTAPRSEVELTTAWWHGGGYGAEAARAGQRRSALVELARSGAAALGRRIPSLNLDPQALAELEADGIIRDVRLGQTVRFVHDIYFEWAFLQLLVSEGPRWLGMIRKVGEPPVLGRVVELLSQAELKEGQDWQANLAQLESATEVRSQWLRAWMVGPLGLPDFDSHETAYNEAMLVTGSKRVTKLVVWYQAEKTKPNPLALDDDRFPHIDLAQRLRFADALALPSDIAQWRRLCDWLVKHIEPISITTRPEVLSVFEVWQNVAADVENPVSKRILGLVKSWLVDIEARFHSRKFPRERGQWDELEDGAVEELESRLRSTLLRAGRAYPAQVKEYLAALQSLERAPRGAVKEVIDYSPILSEACAHELVDFILHFLIRPLPEEQMRRSQEAGRGYSLHSQDWQSLTIDDQHAYFPVAPTRQPFPALFAAAPDEARRLVCDLANHATTAWRQLHQLDWERRARPIPLTLTFPWGEQTFWGASQQFLWSRGFWGSHAVGSGLMALEDWAFKEIEGGRSVDEVLRLVLEGHTCVGALGVACAVTVESQHRSMVTLPLLTSQRLWKWDLERNVQEMGSHSSGLIGFRPNDRIHYEAALHRWSRVLFIDDVAMPGAVRLEAGELCGGHALATEHPECPLRGEGPALRRLRQGAHREEVFRRDHELVATLRSHREEGVGPGGCGGKV